MISGRYSSDWSPIRTRTRPLTLASGTFCLARTIRHFLPLIGANAFFLDSLQDVTNRIGFFFVAKSTPVLKKFHVFVKCVAVLFSGLALSHGYDVLLRRSETRTITRYMPVLYGF